MTMGMTLTEMPAGPADMLNTTGREVELKFLLAEADFIAAQHWAVLQTGAPPPQAKRLKSVYFDTQEGDLAGHGVVLRMRAQGRRHVMTCKWQGDFGGGGE